MTGDNCAGYISMLRNRLAESFSSALEGPNRVPVRKLLDGEGER